MTNLLKQIAYTLFFLIFSANALALQLGQISVNSTQDKPLNVEIDLVVSSGDDLDSLKVKIAGKDIYVPNRAKFSIEHEVGDGENEIEFQIKWEDA